MTDAWIQLAGELATALMDESSYFTPATASEVDQKIGATEFDIVIESTEADPAIQRVAYSALCDLLSTRRAEGADQVMGCLLIEGDPDAAAFADGLATMVEAGGEFTPVMPLTADQARTLIENKVPLFEIVDDSVALVEVAASRHPVTPEVAETALEEIDELVARTENKS